MSLVPIILISNFEDRWFPSRNVVSNVAIDEAHLQPGSLDELISPRQVLLFGNCGKD